MAVTTQILPWRSVDQGQCPFHQFCRPHLQALHIQRQSRSNPEVGIEFFPCSTYDSLPEPLRRSWAARIDFSILPARSSILAKRVCNSSVWAAAWVLTASAATSDVRADPSCKLLSTEASAPTTMRCKSAISRSARSCRTVLCHVSSVCVCVCVCVRCALGETGSGICIPTELLFIDCDCRCCNSCSFGMYTKWDSTCFRCVHRARLNIHRRCCVEAVPLLFRYLHSGGMLKAGSILALKFCSKLAMPVKLRMYVICP